VPTGRREPLVYADVDQPPSVYRSLGAFACEHLSAARADRRQRWRFTGTGLGVYVAPFDGTTRDFLTTCEPGYTLPRRLLSERIAPPPPARRISMRRTPPGLATPKNRARWRPRRPNPGQQATVR